MARMWKVTLYQYVGDFEMWTEVRQFCKDNHVSLSQFISDAVRWYFARLRSTE